jgi:hypothetical protein
MYRCPLFVDFFFGTLRRVYPTWCVLQALIYYILCFFALATLLTVCKLLKNMWIKGSNPRPLWVKYNN